MSARVVLVAALAPLGGCVAIIGTAMSPVTGPVDAVRLAFEEHYSVGELWIVPVRILLSPFAGFLTGVGEDYWLGRYGKYHENAEVRLLRPYYYLPGGEHWLEK